MRYAPMIILFIFMASCSSTKKVTETPNKIVVKPINNKLNLETENRPIPAEPKKNNTSVTPKVVQKTTNKITPIKAEAKEATSYTSSISFNHNKWNDLLQKYVSKQGNVNYKGFKTDRKALINYIKSLSNNIPNNKWAKEDKLAYWMNAYNAMTVDLILRFYPVKSIKDIKDPWEQRFWKLGKKWINLSEIEHDILREMDDPRIHFGIVCASISCPKLQNTAFIPSQVNSQLTKATKEFLKDSTRNEIFKNYYKISKIFQWFSKDFKQDGGLIDFLNKYTDVTISATAKKSFKDYNWDLNE